MTDLLRIGLWEPTQNHPRLKRYLYVWPSPEGPENLLSRRQFEMCNGECRDRPNSISSPHLGALEIVRRL